MTTTTDPDGLAVTSTTRFDAATGKVIETRMPSNPGGGGAGTELTRYYTAAAHPSDAACGNKPAWAGLVCAVVPAAQPGVAGLPVRSLPARRRMTGRGGPPRSPSR